ncbi:MAG: zinc ribbon domain-containing protein [Oscillospiraceae bacterium]|nr:zinc ribbon domain-containing protein [Oscillospiraceae bacterium]
MADINRFVESTRSFAGFVSEKATAALDTGKAYAQRANISVKIREKYTELGKVCYEMHENNTDETGKMKRLIGEINLLKSDLRAAEEESGKKKICPYCGNKNYPDDSFCSKCGSRLDN